VPSVDPIRIFAPAKLNLFLHVGDARADGYHALQSLMAFADVGDELAIEPASGLSLVVDGPFADALESEADNIVLRAAFALAERTGVAANAKITLTKRLPIAAGIGGGSSDAAAALRGLCKLWRVNLTEADLQAIALSLGADVPVCLKGRPCWVEGIGERLTVVPIFPLLHVVLVNPGVAVSTADAYRGLKTRTGVTGEHPAAFRDANALIGFLETAHNDLEEPAARLAPVIHEVLAAFCAEDAALLARMSGSGATCFALYGSAEAARACAAKISEAHPDWWVKAAKIQ
jgi:4-diphosphocytidyl-2-C-methyl-D-erythritol kinase